MAGGNFGGGNGTEANPYLVTDGADLNAVRNNLTAHYKQTTDIDLSSFGEWTPIGNYYVDSSQQFNGTYDGGGFKIKNLLITTGVNFQGLFGRLNDNGILKNIYLENASISALGELVGSICGIVDGTILKCSSSGVIWGLEKVGGIAGQFFTGAIVEDCFSSANVEGNKFVGGLVGYSYAPIKRVYASGEVKGNSQVGGLVGELRNPISDSFALNSKIIRKAGSSSTYFGDVVGYKRGTITNVYSIDTMVFVDE